MTPPAPSRPRRAALFDLDRTLVRTDTASLFVQFQRRSGRASSLDTLRVAWWALLYTFDLVDAPRVATRATAPLRGVDEAGFAARCDDWFRQYVERHISDTGRLRVHRHLSEGDLVAIVTGASPYAARPLARRLGIPHVLASELEVEHGTLTGRPHLPLCFAEGKVARAKGLLAAHQLGLAQAVFYSDSITDQPLLQAVGLPVAVNPDPRLARLAHARGWPVERW
jgi:HAD superfamily hydrolase (TIGR01490 family)